MHRARGVASEQNGISTEMAGEMLEAQGMTSLNGNAH